MTEVLAKGSASDESIIHTVWIVQCVLAAIASLMRPRLKNQCKSMALCCSVHPDLTSLSAELKKSFTFIAVVVDKENTLIMEASPN